jgi:hypothetical protein
MAMRRRPIGSFDHCTEQLRTLWQSEGLGGNDATAVSCLRLDF